MCLAFVSWGFSDSTGPFRLPFDANYKPKPAFHSMLALLKSNGSGETESVSGSTLKFEEVLTDLDKDNAMQDIDPATGKIVSAPFL